MKKQINLFSSLPLAAALLALTGCGHKPKVKGQDDPPKTGYFYFELAPTGSGPTVDHPYYFSQVIAITYTSNNNLTDQENQYYAELLQKIADDGHDNKGYNQKPAPEEGTQDQSQKDKDSVIHGLGPVPIQDVTIPLLTASGHK